MQDRPIDRLAEWAEHQPKKPVIVLADWSVTRSYAELDACADAIARWLIEHGVAAGDVVALLLENDHKAVEFWWGARRAGAYYVPLSGNYSSHEIDHILRDSGVRLLFAAPCHADLATAACGTVPLQVVDPDFALALAAIERRPLPYRDVGREFLYSSGTTGRPKGVRRSLQSFAQRMELPPLEQRMRVVYEITRDTVYLSVTPLHHATGRFLNRVIEEGGTCIIAQRFDPAAMLAAIDRHGATHTQCVPTMFVRLLALPDEIKEAFDGSSLQVVLHSAAPCPQPVKRAMIAWLGPILHEYYGGTENAGVTFIRAEEWLRHPGSVGRPIAGAVHILADPAGTVEQPSGEVGAIYFSGGLSFAYHGDEAKTRTAIRPDGWATYGDYGYVDDEGYLYISDRRDDLVISGGVNLYPREIELVIEQHPQVAEVAVIGVPDEEFGQKLVAVVRAKADGTAALAAELRDHCLAQLSRMKCPRTFRFVEEFPRNENGKLLKRVLREDHAAADVAVRG